MRCVVLEPDGNHWSIDLPPEKAGQFFSKPEETGEMTKVANVRGLRMPIYREVHYVGHQVLDNHGNCYWIYVRK